MMLPLPDVDTPRRPAVLDAIRRAHARGARLIGFCSGAFTLAEAGVLDGRRATVHWQWAARFRSHYPHVHLETDVLFVDEDITYLNTSRATTSEAISVAVEQLRRVQQGLSERGALR